MTGLRRTLRDRRGFTLVELIVVLVILGVLATFAVPALTGYIDSAKEKQAVSEAQACVMTATRQGAQNYALVQNASVAGNAENAAALTNWAGPLEANAPEVTGGKVALTEGSGMYLLDGCKPACGQYCHDHDCGRCRGQGHRAGDDLQRQRAGFVLSVYQRRWDTGRIHERGNHRECKYRQ